MAQWAAVCALGVWAAALAAADIRRMRLPNVLTVPGAAAILAVAALCGEGIPAAAGALALAGVYLAVHLAAPHGLGAGDVKLAVGLGALTGSLGADVWVLAAVTAPALTALAGAVSLARGRGGRVPHGPAMLAASLGIAALAAL